VAAEPSLSDLGADLVPIAFPADAFAALQGSHGSLGHFSGSSGETAKIMPGPIKRQFTEPTVIGNRIASFIIYLLPFQRCCSYRMRAEV